MFVTGRVDSHDFHVSIFLILLWGCLLKWIFMWFLSLNSEQGNVYLSEQGIEYETDFDLWQNIMALLIFAAFFLILTYIRLLTMNKLR